MRVLIKDGSYCDRNLFSPGIRPVLHRFEVFGTKGSTELDFTSGMLCRATPRVTVGASGALLSGYGEAWRRFKYANKNISRMARGEFGYFSGLRYLIRSFYRSIVQTIPFPFPTN